SLPGGAAGAGGRTAPVGTPFGSATFADTWGYSLGDTVLGAHLDAGLRVDANAGRDKVDSAKTHAEVSGGGSLFGKAFTVFKFTGDLSSVSNSQTNVHVDLSLVGQSVYNFQKTAPGTYSDN